MKQNSMLAMILAGGRGSRLHDLTNKVAKPAVSYGGKYRIVDFPLSNCANSGIDVVGVLTQYESVLLNSYVAAGGRWGLDAKDSGVYVLPPREKADAGLDVYRGTADAISQNIDFIDSFAPEYLLILSDVDVVGNKRTVDYGAFFYYYTRHQNTVNDLGSGSDLGSGKQYGILYLTFDHTALSDICILDICLCTYVMWKCGNILCVNLPGRIA